MDRFDEKVFQELISDIHFVKWAKGKEVTDYEKWESWKSNHPENIDEFDEAVKIVNSLSFTPPQIAQNEIQYLWAKTSNKFEQAKSSKVRRLSTLLIRVAAVLFVPLLIYSSWIYYNNSQLTDKYEQLADNSISGNITVVSPIGARTEVDLPDGSKAWLNAASQISYPAVFSDKERKVKLVGEAFFKVQKGKKPFIVENLGPTVKVYGTQFNVNSYQNEETVTVALLEGKVSLKGTDGEKFLKPGQVSFYNKKQRSHFIRTEDLNRFISWREGKFIFRDAPLNSILRVLQRQYNVDIVMENPELGDEKYKFTFQNESIHKILDLLQLSAPLKVTYQKGKILTDGTMTKDKIIISEDNDRIVKK